MPCATDQMMSPCWDLHKWINKLQTKSSNPAQGKDCPRVATVAPVGNNQLGPSREWHFVYSAQLVQASTRNRQKPMWPWPSTYDPDILPTVKVHKHANFFKQSAERFMGYTYFNKTVCSPIRLARELICSQWKTSVFIPPTVWPLNRPEFNPVDYRVWQNLLQFTDLHNDNK